jgi:hypothetical protein
MKKVFLFMIAGLLTGSVFAQQTNSEITKKNAWIKAGIGLGAPVGKLADQSNFALTADVKGQFLSTPHWGVGVATGYTHYFPKTGAENFGSIPVGGFVRYYPARTGVFVGSDVGYSFQTGSHDNSNGGVYVRPQVGYHNRLWNFYGYYNGIFRSMDRGDHLQHVGVGVAYNIMFN